jgi:hypothetical protein
MTPEQAAFLLNIQLPIIRKESEITSRVIKAVPSTKESYRPAPHSRSALELVWHIASCDIWFLEGFLAGKFEMEDDSMPADFSNSADIAAWYDDEFGPKLDLCGFLGHSYAVLWNLQSPCGFILALYDAAYGASSRAALHLSAPDGRQGA